MRCAPPWSLDSNATGSRRVQSDLREPRLRAGVESEDLSRFARLAGPARRAGAGSVGKMTHTALGSESCVLCGRHAAVILSPAGTDKTLPTGVADTQGGFGLCAADELIVKATGLMPRYCPACGTWRRPGLTCPVCSGPLGRVD